jgi:hypothetical protein
MAVWMKRLGQRLTDLPHQLRVAREELPGRWQAWREALREDPSIFWRTTIVQVIGLILLVALGIVVSQRIVAAFTPAGDTVFRKPDRTAVLYVACTNPACLASATIERPREFHDWPVTCAKCGQKTAYRAIQCPTCKQWYAPTPSSDGTPPAAPAGGSAADAKCPHCAAAKAKASQATRPAGPARKAEDEDPW